MLFICSALQAQDRRTVKGQVLDEKKEPLIGATVTVKGNKSIGTVTDIDGKFTLNIPAKQPILVISFVSYETKEVNTTGKNNISIEMTNSSVSLEDVVVVGYGQQKKTTLVGAITQTDGKVLERAGGVSNVGAALTGNLPGVVTMQTSGVPGAEDPKIIIRGSSSWNNSDPLVLVDGIERPMSGVDINSVQSISVLKDASATAVYGVKGANGVILITTKRGQEGRAKIDVGFSTTLKTVSKLPNKLDSYDALMARNVAIEHELALTPESWAYIKPQDIIRKYRYPANVTEAERYPNVDWQKELFKNYTTSNNVNINIMGGTSFVKYFASADYVREGDLFKIWDNGRNYKSGYGYNRLNVRSNLDFQLTKTTGLKVNIAGSNALSKRPWGNTNTSDWAVAQQWAGAYNIAPDVFLPKYSDGTWGYYPNVSNVTNSAEALSVGGVQTLTNTRITTDFALEQDLKFITKGLSFRGALSFDNAFADSGRGINDLYHDAPQKWIDPDTGVASYSTDYDKNNKFDYAQGVLWSTSGGSVSDYSTYRNVNYQMQLNWARKLGLNNVTAMGLFQRQETATGSVIPSYREDWVFRVTYNFSDKYFAEYNGAYNGSEKFAAKNRFGFFNSGAIGWLVSQENFMKPIKFLDMLKVRASLGEIGDDSGGRFLYMSQWSTGGATNMSLNGNASPYSWYREATVGNPDVNWEKVRKLNIGADYAFLQGLIAGTVDVFQDNRRDILVDGNSRSVPSYFGQSPATANLGKVRTNGYEIEVRLNKTFKNKMHLWGNFSMTHAKNIILVKDDPALLPAYQKAAGYSIGQYKAYVSSGYVNNYDQIYGSTQHDKNDMAKLPGDYNVLDFNGDGVIDSKDNIPYGYSGSPQNTYNATLGCEWKGLSLYLQFYGVNNVTRDVNLVSFGSKLNTVYDQGTWWSKENPTADVTVPRWSSTPSYNTGTQYLYDGSYIRLKNAEIAYTVDGKKLRRFGMSSLKVYLNGNNLWVWSRMPDDRESNYGGASGQGAYPTVKRFNLGLKITL
ncbi:TonB-dependent receptor [Paludibacter sp.]|uniref:SusC/RagA family TonB-linked outer membrane protein n=1 Tax=Paludibacter sp. TaxID=1898105 RepID=UPI0013551639|nr:TonB-dependent receptor [Paludibacter sp.]MTK54494.1 TonB-dependent receptor [Paludibacter sp.]